MSSPGYSDNADLLIQPVLITITVAHIPKQHLNITTYAEGPTSVGEQAGERDFEAATPNAPCHYRCDYRPSLRTCHRLVAGATK